MSLSPTISAATSSIMSSSRTAQRIDAARIQDGSINTIQDTCVDDWISKLPLAERLSDCFTSKKLADVAALSPQEIAEASKRFCTDFEDFLKGQIALLKNSLDALAIAQDNAANGKFFIYQGSYGSIEGFHKPFYDEIGNPNPEWLQGLIKEHQRNKDMFKTSNYNIDTTPEDELAYVLGDKLPKDEHMGHGRRLQSVDVLLQLEESIKAGLTRAEVIALQLYTGPMYQIYNTVLRKYPMGKYEELRDKDSLFPTTICVLVSAVQKLARVMPLQPGTVLYRGIDGNMALPARFSTPDENGCLGGMEPGFMSTTSDLKIALFYASGCLLKIIKIVVGSVDRGADISSYSQYPGEKEILITPHAFLEPIGGPELMITDKGVVQVIRMKLNVNFKAVTIEEYEKRKMQLHLSSFKFLLQDLQLQLEKMCSDSGKIDFSKKFDETFHAKDFITKIMEQCDVVRKRQASEDVKAYNHDAIFRGLMVEMLDTRLHAVVKLEDLLTCQDVMRSTVFDKPLLFAFRDRMRDLVRELKSSPSHEKALIICKNYGLVKQSVSEVNDWGETPLINAIADGVSDDKIELLLKAGSDVNNTVSYGDLERGMTPLLVASKYGRSSTISLLVANGADLHAVDDKGWSAAHHAVENDFPATVRVLHSLGIDVNKATNDGSTAIMSAAVAGHVFVLQGLVSLGADVNKTDDDGWTAIMKAALSGHVSVVQALGRLGADVNKTDDDGGTAIMSAAVAGHVSVVHALVGLGGDVNKTDDDGWSAIMLAAQAGHVSVVQALVSLGADASIVCDEGNAMDMAVIGGHTEVVEVLEAVGIRPTRDDSDGDYM